MYNEKGSYKDTKPLNPGDKAPLAGNYSYFYIDNEKDWHKAEYLEEEAGKHGAVMAIPTNKGVLVCIANTNDQHFSEVYKDLNTVDITKNVSEIQEKNINASIEYVLSEAGVGRYEDISFELNINHLNYDEKVQNQEIDNAEFNYQKLEEKSNVPQNLKEANYDNPLIVNHNNSEYSVFLIDIEGTPKVPEHKSLHIVNKSGITLAQLPYSKDHFDKLNNSEITNEIHNQIDKAELNELKIKLDSKDKELSTWIAKSSKDDKQIAELTEKLNKEISSHTQSTIITVPQIDRNNNPVRKSNGEIATATLTCPHGLDAAMGQLIRDNAILRSENRQLRNQINNNYTVNNDISGIDR